MEGEEERVLQWLEGRREDWQEQGDRVVCGYPEWICRLT